MRRIGLVVVLALSVTLTLLAAEGQESRKILPDWLLVFCHRDG